MTAIAKLNRKFESELSLFQLLKPEILADPHVLYRRIREYEPVHWDPYLNSWVVTSYAETMTALTRFKAARTRTPELLEKMGLGILGAYAEVMLQQLPFIDAPDHTRLRAICSVAFTPARTALLRDNVQSIADSLIDAVIPYGKMDIVEDFSAHFTPRVITVLLGLPEEDYPRLRQWVLDYGELVGSFENDPTRVEHLIVSLNDLKAYLATHIQAHIDGRKPVREEGAYPGVIETIVDAEVNGQRLSFDQILSNTILFLNAGLDETASLISNGMLSLLQRPEKQAELTCSPNLMQSAVEEFLRFESTTQYTGRTVPEDTVLGGKHLRKGDSVTAVLAAANRDPERFAHPDDLNLTRADNRHLAFSWGSHYCLGAPLVRMAAGIAFSTLLRRLPGLALVPTRPRWRSMAAMRGVESLDVLFNPSLPTVQ